MSFIHTPSSSDLSLDSRDYSDKPWLKHRHWGSSRIKSRAKRKLWLAWLFTLIWNGLIFTALYRASNEQLADYPEVLVLLSFSLVGIGILTWSLVITRRFLRFGDAPLTMDPYPGAIGGQVGGAIDLRLPFDPSVEFEAVLSCVYSHMSGGGKNRSRSERLVWQSEGYAITRSYSGLTHLEFLFDVPDNLPVSDLKRGRNYHLWRLRVQAKLPGADFDRSYEIPVFPTSERAARLRNLSTEHASARKARLQAVEYVLNLEQVPGGVELYYPAFRHIGAKLLGIVIGLVFIAAGVFVGYSGGPVVFPILFPLMGASVAIASAYVLFVSQRVRLDHEFLLTEKRILGCRVGGTKLPRNDITTLKLKKSYSVGQGGKHIQFFTMQALTQSGQAVGVGRGLPGRETALEALESISVLTGIPFEESGGLSTDISGRKARLG